MSSFIRLFFVLAFSSLSAQAAPYQAPAWLFNGHLQTIYASILSSLPEINYRRERWATPDGDFIDVDWMEGPQDAPLVVLFHGLEGNSGSHYALTLMDMLQQKGLRGVVVHFRGTTGEPNLLPRAYHAGDTAEVDWILRRLREANSDVPIYAVGVSLGGNALLKWLGESSDKAQGVIEAAVAISAPVDLQATGNALSAGFNQIYGHIFLDSLKYKALQKLERYPLLYDRETVENIRTIREFDTQVTAILHGFKDADDYWIKASSKLVLQYIRVPTLLINARNDPFLPAWALPEQGEVSSCVTLEFPEEGGHVAFVSGPFPGNLNWLPERIIDFFGIAAIEPDSKDKVDGKEKDQIPGWGVVTATE